MASIIRTDALQNLNTSNIITQTNATTITIGASGQTISLASGANQSGFGFDGVIWTSNIVTSALTASVNVGYFVNTSSAAITVTLPASASVGDQLIFTDFNRTWGTNALTLNQNSLNFQGYTDPNPVYNTAGQTAQLVYSGSTQGWIPISDDDVTNEVPQTVSIDFLVVAGGGGGGGGISGAGGAGGYRTSTQSVNPGVAITVTVGGGGTGGVGAANGTAGSNSSISGSGLTTITSAGGGYGSTYENVGGSGGSGGGGGSIGTNAGGAGNTPSTSPSQGNNGGAGTGGPYRGGGGGGGAGAVGGNANSTTAGNGGNGSASSITGSSVTYAGGGGGGNDPGGGVGTGGTGGGGAGTNIDNATGTAGTTNLGGGGGGSGRSAGGNAIGGAGGSGVVILRMLTTKYSGTTTGSPTVTTDGSYKVLKFTGSGSYTT